MPWLGAHIKSEAAARFVVKQNQTAAITMRELTSEYLMTQGYTGTIIPRFFSKVAVGDGCWIWKAYLDQAGYGRITRGLIGPERSHRVSWFLFVGEIPFGMDVLHSCPGGDNRACVNPKHLRLGSDIDNVRDRVERGRQTWGENHPPAKLTANQVREIKELYSTGSSRKELCIKFKMSTSGMRSILLNVNWNKLNWASSDRDI